MTDTHDLPSVRILTLNLDMNPARLADRLPAAAQMLTEQAPDVVLLQEIAQPAVGHSAAEELALLTGLPLVAAAWHAPMARGVNGVAVLSRLPCVGTAALDLPDPDYAKRAIAAHLTSPSGRALLAVSAHLSWGGDREPARLRQAQLLDAWTADLTAGVTDTQTVTVLGGDFNATADSDTHRFLTGQHAADGAGAYWVDAWCSSGAGDGHTSTPSNEWVAATAALVGITRPDLLPARRIDHVLVRGWMHGRPGCPLRSHIAGDVPCGPAHVLPSDHYALVTDLWDPPAI